MEAVLFPAARIVLDIFCNHAEIIFGTHNMVVERPLPDILFKWLRCALFYQMDVFDRTVSFKRLYDFNNRRGGYRIRPYGLLR